MYNWDEDFIKYNKILSMKVPFPKNIKKWLLAGMTLNLGPISLSIVQLLIVAVWVWLALAVFNSASKSGSTAAWVIFAVPVLVIFLVFAFFKVSEMGMVEYIAKLFRNKFFDTTKKYQVNFSRFDQTKILIEESKLDDKKVKIKQKENKLDKDLLKNIEGGGLI